MEQRKILIVDDSAVMRKILRDALEGAGYAVLEATNGKDAIDVCNLERPHLMFLDMIMPDVSGMDVLRVVGKEVRTIVASAVGQDAMIQAAKEFGAVDYIVKPFDIDRVLQKAVKYVR